ncbi:hypothetical protein [Marinibactrum halimedae]|uniref:SLATT domain-containing protein n=1 Tax=Marinibactrum halimedae TaxID=1444977 RepID=A0AA37TDQ1_9GAMM|nr:hypothetical protein [Marinibactrum halimedae]MCD9460591.1 hypothetical protein [Marinibactrum halimedae]GLS27222.1 hypothetical protein GCM10007877_29410 [Marinibactrum halimedae]
MNREILQNQYDAEMERKVSLSSAVNVPIVALTVIATATSTMILKLPYSHSAFTYIFISIVAISVAFSGYAVILLFKSLVGHNHAKLPLSRELKEHYEKLISWYREQEEGEESSVQSANQDFEDYFNDCLIEAADINSENNIIRGGYIHEATVNISRALIALFLASPFFLYVKINTEPPVHKIEIINHDQGKIMNDKKQTTTSKPTTSEKPQGPPVKIFKDNSNKSSRGSDKKG